MTDKSITFELLSEKEGYKIYYTVAPHFIKTGNEKTMMFVFKDDEIIYVPKYVNSQFKMKQACDEFIEKQIMNIYKGEEVDD